MFNWIDAYLNKTTMYRLVLQVLEALWGIAFVFSVFKILPFEPFGMVLTLGVILGSCWIVNEVLARTFKTQANVESLYITALILTLVINPVQTAGIISALPFLISVSAIAMASKFIFAINKKHIFNPAAFAVAVTAATLGQSASWWVNGNLPMLPFVIIGAVLIIKKIQRWDLALSFLFASFVSVGVSTWLRGFSPLDGIQKSLLHSPVFFFMGVMITEPLTTPPTRGLRMLYGALVGLLFAPNVHIGSVYSTPELALLAGNIFSYLVSPKGKTMLALKEKIQLTPDTYDFVFECKKLPAYTPGQYMEWTLGHSHPDTRGNRRYFTLASSPTEPNLRLGVKFNTPPSTFKKRLLEMKAGDEMMVGQLAGDFTLPKDPTKKLVFIAGGIGVTPYRSMLKYVSDRKEKRDIVFIFSNKTAGDIVYRDVFDEAGRTIGLKSIYLVTNPNEQLPAGLHGYTKMLDADIIKNDIPDYLERTFYISGPRSMTMGVEGMLIKMGVPRSHIKTDFFPGFA